MKGIGLVLTAIAIALAATVRIGSISWRRRVNRLLGAMRADTRAARRVTERFFIEEVELLPPPVRRYFAFALSQGQPLVVAAHATSQGDFRLRLDGGWHSFTAVQDYSASPRAFLWDARIQVVPLLSVNVADRYLGGQGAIDARAVSVVPVAKAHGTPELAAGELLRYLAELVMMPTALLPRSGVVWSPIDDTSARVTLTDRGTTVSVIFTFGPRGGIVKVSALRHRDVSGTAVLTPWVGHFREYRSIQGMMVPLFGEVAWVVDDVVMPYFLGRTTKITFELAA